MTDLHPDKLVERAARVFEAKALSLAQDRGETHLSPGLDEMDAEMRASFYACLGAAIEAAGVPTLQAQLDRVREALAKWREEIQQCLDNVPAFAKQNGMSQDEANGREYAWAYALAAMEDRTALQPLNGEMGK